MTDNYDFSRVGKIVSQNSSFSICLPTVLTADSVAAATTLYIGLSKLGKNVTMAGDSDWTGAEKIIGAEKIQRELTSEGDNLVISFPYKHGEIDKITSDVSGENLNIYIYPQEGQKSPDPKQVKYRYKGSKVDVLIILDSPTLRSLGQIHSENESLFSGGEIINIDRHFTNANFGSVNIVDKRAASLCQIVFELLKNISVPLDNEMASNLYLGLVSATKNFTAFSVGPQIFELAAELTRAGARTAKVVPAPMFARPQGMRSPLPQFNPGVQSPDDQIDNFDLKSLYGVADLQESAVPVQVAPNPSSLPKAIATPAEFEPYEEVLDENIEPAETLPQAAETPIENIENKENNQSPQEAKNILKPNLFKGGGGRGGNLV